jgi:Excalibur calcium-binding domain
VKRGLAIGALIALAVLAIAWLPSPASARADKDCADFATQRAAQIFFLKHGGPRYDPDRLDGDDDGIACEDNPCPCYYRKHLPHRANREALDSKRQR